MQNSPGVGSGLQWQIRHKCKLLGIHKGEPVLYELRDRYLLKKAEGVRESKGVSVTVLPRIPRSRAYASLYLDLRTPFLLPWP